MVLEKVLALFFDTFANYYNILDRTLEIKSKEYDQQLHNGLANLNSKVADLDSEITRLHKLIEVKDEEIKKGKADLKESKL
jgi:X-X-X-Leu-X-X-Gly heptad repeat protein